MAAILLLAALGTGLSFYAVAFQPATKPAQDLPAGRAVAADLLLYHKAAVSWCVSTACPDGPIPAQALALPGGMAKAGWVRATAAQGTVTTVAAGIPVSVESIRSALREMTAGAQSNPDGVVVTKVR